MREEKLMILTMLEEGKITSEEAVKLLEALEEIDESSYSEQTKKTQSNKLLNKTLEEIGLDISNAFTTMISGLRDFGGSFGINPNFDTMNLELNQDISHIEKPIIDLRSVNGSIKLNKSDSDDISLKVNCQFKNGLIDNNKDFYKFYIEGNRVIFIPLYHNDMSIKLDVYLPDKEYENIILNTTNAKVEIDNFKMNTLECFTSNGSINAASVSSDKINLSTKNGRIELTDIISGNIKANTTNSRINLKNIESQNITCKTSNGTIDASDISSEVIQFTTSNAKILLGNINYKTLKDIELITSNSSISSEINNIEKEIFFDLETSMGNINLGLPNLVYKVNNQVNLGVKRIIAHSMQYDKDREHIKFFASTSNGSIKIN